VLERKYEEKSRVSILEEKRNEELNNKLLLNNRVIDELKRRIGKLESTVNVTKEKAEKSLAVEIRKREKLGETYEHRLDGTRMTTEDMRSSLV
jgi:hypothetical protein